MNWQPIATSPMTETEPFLVLRPGNDVAPFVIEQVSRFEGQMYPDAKHGFIDWDDRITDATHWAPVPDLPVVTKRARARV